MNRKSDLRVMIMVMEEIPMVPKCLHLSSTDGATNLSLVSPYASLLMPTMWHFSLCKSIHLCMLLWSSSSRCTN